MEGNVKIFNDPLLVVQLKLNTVLIKILLELHFPIFQ